MTLSEQTSTIWVTADHGSPRKAVERADIGTPERIRARPGPAPQTGTTGWELLDQSARIGNPPRRVEVDPRMSELIPSDYAALLERPHYGHLGTIRPDNTVQVNPMWFEYDGRNLRFTHTRKRAKFRNLQHNPSMSLSIIDPDNPFRFLELRGALVDVEPDPTGAFYVRLGKRYGNPGQQPPPDSADRVVLVMSIEKSTKQ
jgi:PPOX class probable F420-dependent enzyme